jgi:hypothetical protein
MPRRITVTAIGTPPPLTPSILHPIAMEILHRLEAQQAAERQGELEGQEGRLSSRRTPRPDEP